MTPYLYNYLSTALLPALQGVVDIDNIYLRAYQVPNKGVYAPVIGQSEAISLNVSDTKGNMLYARSLREARTADRFETFAIPQPGQRLTIQPIRLVLYTQNVDLAAAETALLGIAESLTRVDYTGLKAGTGSVWGLVKVVSYDLDGFRVLEQEGAKVPNDFGLLPNGWQAWRIDIDVASVVGNNCLEQIKCACPTPVSAKITPCCIEDAEQGEFEFDVSAEEYEDGYIVTLTAPGLDELVSGGAECLVLNDLVLLQFTLQDVRTIRVNIGKTGAAPSIELPAECFALRNGQKNKEQTIIL